MCRTLHKESGIVLPRSSCCWCCISFQTSHIEFRKQMWRSMILSLSTCYAVTDFNHIEFWKQMWRSMILSHSTISRQLCRHSDLPFARHIKSIVFTTLHKESGTASPRFCCWCCLFLLFCFVFCFCLIILNSGSRCGVA